PPSQDLRESLPPAHRAILLDRQAPNRQLLHFDHHVYSLFEIAQRHISFVLSALDTGLRHTDGKLWRLAALERFEAPLGGSDPRGHSRLQGSSPTVYPRRVQIAFALLHPPTELHRFLFQPSPDAFQALDGRCRHSLLVSSTF